MSSKSEAHWAKTKSLTITTLIIWVFFSFIIHWFGDSLNSDSFPFTYFMAGQGSQVAFAILVFWFARKQGNIDEEFDMQEN